MIHFQIELQFINLKAGNNYLLIVSKKINIFNVLRYLFQLLSFELKGKMSIEDQEFVFLSPVISWKNYKFFSKSSYPKISILCVQYLVSYR